MHPILIALPKIGDIDPSLHTYGVMMALAFVVGIWLAVREARRTGADPELVMDLAFWVLIAGLVGSRILFIIVNIDQYWYICVDTEHYNTHYDPPEPIPHATSCDKVGNCLTILKVWTGGLVFYGGLIGALWVGWQFCRRNQLSYLRMADIMIPSVALGQCLGRLGCLAAGCCWGKPCSLPWGIHLPAGGMAWKGQVDAGIIDRWAETTAAIHPTQFYESIATLSIFVLLTLFRPRKRYHGQVLLLYLLVYPVVRSTIEVFRGDKERGSLFHWGNEALNAFLGLPEGSWVLLSTSQFISLLVAAAALVTLVVLRRRRLSG